MPDRSEQHNTNTEDSIESGDIDHDSGPALKRTGGKKKGRKFNRKGTK